MSVRKNRSPERSHERHVAKMPDRLHAEDLETRFRASVEAGEETLSIRWPAGCGGAANPFLVLLGPSPGVARAGEGLAKTLGTNRPHGKLRRIGPGAMSFDWGDHRAVRWTRLCTAMLGNEQRARALTALLNLDWRHTTNAKDIPLADLRAGWRDHIGPLLSDLQPRIVCALTNRVWRAVSEALEPDYLRLPPCPAKLTREPFAVMLSGCNSPTLFLKAQNHPSRFLSDAHMSELGKACRWFLDALPSRQIPTAHRGPARSR